MALRRINLGYFAHFGAGGRSRAVRTHAAAQDSVSEECSSLASQKSINRTYVSLRLYCKLWSGFIVNHRGAHTAPTHVTLHPSCAQLRAALAACEDKGYPDGEHQAEPLEGEPLVRVRVRVRLGFGLGLAPGTAPPRLAPA